MPSHIYLIHLLAFLIILWFDHKERLKMERLHKLLSSQKVLNKYNQAGKGTHRIEADWLSIFYKDLNYGS